jgi:hypothetical protein
MATVARFLAPVDGIPIWQFAARVLWVAVQLILVICVGQKGVLFFYQGF